MTFEEFKEIIERTGEYQVSDGRASVKVFHQGKEAMCYISKTRLFGINTIFSENEDFFKEHLDTIIEFAKTPIEDRYPVKKYYVKLDLSHVLDEEECYLNRHMTFDGNIDLSHALDEKLCYLNRHTTFDGNIEQWMGSKNGFTFRNEIYQTQFTMEEIEEIIPKEDMDKFKFIPVEEEE